MTAPATDPLRIVVYDWSGHTLADEQSPALDVAIPRAQELHRQHGHPARVTQRGFELGLVVDGKWVAR